MRLFKDKVRLKAFFALAWIACAISAIWIGYDFSIKNIGYSPSQSIAFSHKTHCNKFNIKCLYCHSDAEVTSFVTVPSVQTCMSCHLGLNTKKELTKSLIELWDSSHYQVWNRVYRLPDYVKFNHFSHLQANIDCSSCHGYVDTLDNMVQYTDLSMSWCLSCHRGIDDNMVPSRDISGIFSNEDNKSILEINTTKESIIKPAFGMWNYFVQKSNLSEVPAIKTNLRGPEYCSSCHH
jgi:hypothetical protein